MNEHLLILIYKKLVTESNNLKGGLNMTYKGSAEYDESYRIPKQFNSKLEVEENISVVTTQTARQMNEEYRRNCEIHDIIDKESRIVEYTICAEA